MEPDTEYAMCYPPHPAFIRICEIFPLAFGRNGADPTIGRRVTELFREAGLEDIGVEARVQLPGAGDENRRRATCLEQQENKQRNDQKRHRDAA